MRTVAFSASELVYLPPRRVWALLTDWSAAPVWMSGVTEMHADGPTRIGAALEFHAAGHERSATITALTPGQGIAISYGEGDVRTDYRYKLTPDGEDTRLDLTVDVVVAEPLAEMAGQIGSAVAEADAGQLASFKRFAESAP